MLDLKPGYLFQVQVPTLPLNVFFLIIIIKIIIAIIYYLILRMLIDVMIACTSPKKYGTYDKISR